MQKLQRVLQITIQKFTIEQTNELRYGNHKKSFYHEQHRNDTVLSNLMLVRRLNLAL